jgi:hypothetical protein
MTSDELALYDQTQALALKAIRARDRLLVALLKSEGLLYVPEECPRCNGRGSYQERVSYWKETLSGDVLVTAETPTLFACDAQWHSQVKRRAEIAALAEVSDLEQAIRLVEESP